MFSGKTKLAFSLMVSLLAAMGAASPLALADTHPFLGEFGSFTNPNGIAIDESTGDVYVADIGTNAIYKFDAEGKPVDFTEGSGSGTNALTGTDTPAPHAFSFPNAPDTPASIAVDNANDPSDPSRGDLYVMDAGNNVIDKFNAEGKYLNQIAGFTEPLLGIAVDSSGNLRVAVDSGSTETPPPIALFDDAVENTFVKLVAFSPESSYTTGLRSASERAFAVAGASDAVYGLFACGCAGKFGRNGEVLGRVDGGSSAVALAADQLTGHVYVDDGSSVTEWDTGQMNGGEIEAGTRTARVSSGVSVSTFGSLVLSAATQGGIAVNGATGSVYVSNPAAGKVDIFADTAPVALVAATTAATQTSATLHGTVNPRGAPIKACRFEYDTRLSSDLTLAFLVMSHQVSCAQTPEQIGSGTSPVAVSADVTGLDPGSLYRFRLVVESENGVTQDDGLFPTVSAGFGIRNFEAKFLNADGTPDTQAGSHPYEMVTSIEYNTQIVHPPHGDLRWVALPDGNFRDVTVDLPPGFVGDPNATTKKCTIEQLVPIEGTKKSACPIESQLGTLEAEYWEGVGKLAPQTEPDSVVSMVPPPGVALQLSVHLKAPNAFVDVGVPAGGDSGARAVVTGAPVTVPVYRTRLSIRGGAPTGSTKPFLTMPTACNGPLVSTVEADSYQDPGRWAEAKYETLNSAGTPGGMTGCAQLDFPPSIAAKPDTPNASSASGLTVDVHVSQKAALNPDGLAESTLRDTTVALPPGVAINPSGGGGLEGCSDGLAGVTGFAEFNKALEPGDRTITFTPTPLEQMTPGVSFCPDASKVGTAKLKTPLLDNSLEGAVYLAAQNANPFGSLLAMYMMIEDPVSGTTVKIPFGVHLCQGPGEAIGGLTCRAPGQIITTAHNTPQLPFEDLELHFFGGERAPLTTPSRCGTYTTEALFTPWDGNGPVPATSSFEIEHGPHGGPCPGAHLPFSAVFTGGSTNLQAGSFTPLTGTFSREDGEQQMKRVHFTLPPGLSGVLTGVKLCPEAQANAGTCGPDSLIGETTVSAGVGSEPVSVEGGKVYLTEKYHGSPFGLSVVAPVKAGPFDLEHDTSRPESNMPACDCIVVRARIDVNPLTSALTITSNAESEGFAIPSFIDGVPVQIKKINFTTTRKEFQFNPTNCAKMAIAGTVESDEGESRAVEVPFQVTNCATLGFAPKFSASTSGRTSKANGASLKVKLAYPKAPFGSQANVRSVKVELPHALPSRLTTLQKACTAAVFNANPANCPAASIVGHARAITPILPVPVEGPAYFVSHGGEAFPSLIVVLQGYGVTIDLVGTTFISKAGITSSTFKAVPDVPVSTFELTLPQGRFSALTTNTNICKPTRTVRVRRRLTKRVHGHVVHVMRTVTERVAAPLAMPTAFTAQNGAAFKQTTKIAVTGCPKVKKAKTKKGGRGSSSLRHGRRATGRK